MPVLGVACRQCRLLACPLVFCGIGASARRRALSWRHVVVMTRMPSVRFTARTAEAPPALCHPADPPPPTPPLPPGRRNAAHPESAIPASHHDAPARHRPPARSRLLHEAEAL